MFKKITYSIVHFFESLSGRFLAIAAVTNIEITKGKHNPLLIRIRAFLLGYTSPMLKFFNENFKDKYRYTISEFESRYRIYRINENYGILLADKQIAYTFFHDFLEFLPRLYFHINNGVFIENGSGGKSYGDLIQILRREGKLIAKATRSYGGRDIYLLEHRENDNFAFNGKIVSEKEFVDKMSALQGDHIVTEYVKQAEYSSKIYPSSANTIRILTLYDSETGECWIAGAVHRFGTSNSGYVDNINSGGMAALVDIDTGMMEDCLIRDPVTEEKVHVNSHPDTGTVITGTVVHNWSYIKEKILVMARYAFKNPYIGWDVVPTEKGFKIVEINDCPDIQLIQFFTPVLKDERNRRFFSKYKIKPKK